MHEAGHSKPVLCENPERWGGGQGSGGPEWRNTLLHHG